MKKILIAFFITVSVTFANDFFNDLNKRPEPGPMVENPTMEKALEAYKNNDFQTSGDIFAALLTEGDIRAFSYLAEIFGEAKGVNLDCQKGVFFLFNGLKEGDCRSNKVISDWYEKGICLKSANKAKSKKYLKVYESCKK